MLVNEFRWGRATSGNDWTIFEIVLKVGAKHRESNVLSSVGLAGLAST